MRRRGNPTSNDDDIPPKDDNVDKRYEYHNHHRRRMVEEMKIIKNFENVLVSDITTSKLNKWDVIQKESDIVWKLFRCVGVMEGTTAGIVTFLGLHKFPRYLAKRGITKSKRMRHQSHHPHYQQKQDKFQRTLLYRHKAQQTLKQLQQEQQSPFRQAEAARGGGGNTNNKTKMMNEKLVNQSRRRFLFSSMEIIFDIGMSIGMGICVALISSDKKEFQRLFVTIPMQPGKSILSDQICTNLLKEYQNQWRYNNNNNNNNFKKQQKNDRDGDVFGDRNHHHNDGQEEEEEEEANSSNIDSRRSILMEPRHPVLQMIKSLAENCRHRQVMENQIRRRQEQQQDFLLLTPPPPPPPQEAGPVAAVSIPESGVIPMSEDPLLLMMMEEEDEEEEANKNSEDDTSTAFFSSHGGGGGGGDGEDFSHLVQDQEEDR